MKCLAAAAAAGPSPARAQALPGVLLLAASVCAASACPLQAADGHLLSSTEGGVRAAWRVQGAAEPLALPPARQPFVLIVTLCPQNTRLQAVDARMPEHRHGMNYRPSFQPLGEGRWRVQGLLWHMPGRWQWRFELEHGGLKQVLTGDVHLP